MVGNHIHAQSAPRPRADVATALAQMMLAQQHYAQAYAQQMQQMYQMQQMQQMQQMAGQQAPAFSHPAPTSGARFGESRTPPQLNGNTIVIGRGPLRALRCISCC